MFHESQFQSETVTRETLIFAIMENKQPDSFKLKRKWQIALRRYIIEEKANRFYAPYFGLDVKTLKEWVEKQFVADMKWSSYSRNWQISQYIPVQYFNFSKDYDLKLCWNYMNLKVEPIGKPDNMGFNPSALARYFETLFSITQLTPAKLLANKAKDIEREQIVLAPQVELFLKDQLAELRVKENYGAYEFELLNNGSSLPDVQKEIEILQKFSS